MERERHIFCILIKNLLHSDTECYFDEVYDWLQLEKMAKQHNLFPMFFEAASKYNSYTEELGYYKAMQEAMNAIAMQVKRTSAFLKLYQSFSKEGLYPIVVKGLICRELYGELCDHRPSGDEDILIRPSEYLKVKQILIANGYELEDEPELEKQIDRLQEISFYNALEKLHIELHFNLMGRENDARSKMSDYFKDVFEEYREVNIGGIEIRTLSHQNHLLYLILHAFKHFIGGGFGIRQMLDILLYHEKFGQEIDIAQLNRALERFKADKFWSDLIFIGNAYLGFELPNSREANCPEELLEDMLFCGVFGNGTQAQRAAARTTLFSTGDYLKNKKTNQFVMFWRTIFPNKVYLLHNAPHLEDKPWLLPVEWVKRWGRFIKRSIRNDGNLTDESMKISQKRMNLLKKYNLM